MTQYWVGQGLVDAERAVVSVLDHGLTVGDGVFETILVRDGVPFALTRHLARLGRSLAGLGIAGPSDSLLRDAVAAVVRDSGIPSSFSRLRITVTSGAGRFGSERGDADPTLIVTMTPAPAWPPTTTLATVPWTRNERSALAGVKSTSYGENVVALATAAQRGASEALFANTRDELCEGTGSNVFVGLGGRLLTPPVESGCLAGVTRALLLALGVGEEETIPMAALDGATEMFLVSTAREVQPVQRIDGRNLPACPGPMTIAARAAWVAAHGE